MIKEANGCTPVQQAMLRVLSDGIRHDPKELHACLPDQEGALSNIQMHLSNIRKVLRPKGQDVICELANRRVYYRWVRLLTHDN